MFRRKFFAVLAAAATSLVASGGSGRAASTKVSKVSKDDAEILRLLQANGVITKEMTWEKIAEISKKLGMRPPTGGGAQPVWKIIVKGKFIYMDDEK